MPGARPGRAITSVTGSMGDAEGIGKGALGSEVYIWGGRYVWKEGCACPGGCASTCNYVGCWLGEGGV